jgi:hypothetical protein
MDVPFSKAIREIADHFMLDLRPCPMNTIHARSMKRGWRGCVAGDDLGCRAIVATVGIELRSIPRDWYFNALEGNDMNLNLTIDFDQLKNLINQCGIREKTEIVRMLQKETFPYRFHRFLDKIGTEDLTLEEVADEVEAVRAERYCEKRR